MKKGNFTGWLTQVLPEKQMSEAFINSIFLAMSGGFQDAYTYFTRGKVFSNAQTGNVVLMSQHFMMGEWKDGLKYLLPLLAFAFGVLAAERIQAQFRFARRLHWRQGILLLEIAILLIVGFLPQTLNMTATILVSFSCAMQVQAFRKVDGYSYASTMCIGNMRSGTEALCAYFRTKDKAILKKALTYFAVILVFAVGAGVGSFVTGRLGEKSICISCGLLLISFGMMFIREEEELILSAENGAKHSEN